MKKKYTLLCLLSLLATLRLNAAANQWIGGTGSWTQNSNWSFGHPPTSAEDMAIASGTATLPSNITVNSLTMNGGTLTGGFNLTVNQGLTILNAAALFSVGGTVTVTGNFTLSSGTFAPEGTATIGGNFLWNTNGSIGVSTSPSVTDVIIGGTTTIDGNISRNLVKRKLILNGGGTWTLGSISVSEGGILELAAGQTLSYNSTGGYNLTDGDGMGNAFNIKGTLELQSNGFKIRIPVNNTGAINLSNGNLNFENNSTHTGNGSINISATRQLTISNAVGLDYGNATFTNNGTIITNALIFNGSTPQTLLGDGSIATLTINNPNGLSISGTQIITTALTLTNGNIQLSTNDLSLGTATLTGGSSSSYVKTNSTGNLKRSVGNTDVSFPVGESNYTPVTMRHTSGTDVYAVRVSDGIDIAHPLLGTQFVAKEWDISRATVSATAATVKMEWNAGEEGVGFSCATAQMLHHNGTTWQALPLSGTTTSCATSPRSITKTGVTSFSPFSVGLPAFVLSAELIDFKAISHKSTVNLSWQTASEKDLSHFEIEQSTDGSTFSKIGEIKAVNKPNSYVFNVEGLLSILTYFRLKIVNSDGRFTYSKVLSVAFGKDLTVKAFPNPVQNELTIDVFSEAKYLDFEVVDVLGRLIYQKKEENTDLSRESRDGSKLLTINALDWVSGIYFLKVSDGKKVVEQKIVKR